LATHRTGDCSHAHWRTVCRSLLDDLTHDLTDGDRQRLVALLRRIGHAPA
jgi:hypothetical protein